MRRSALAGLFDAQGQRLALGLYRRDARRFCSRRARRSIWARASGSELTARGLERSARALSSRRLAPARAERPRPGRQGWYRWNSRLGGRQPEAPCGLQPSADECPAASRGTTARALGGPAPRNSRSDATFLRWQARRVCADRVHAAGTPPSDAARALAVAAWRREEPA